MSEHTSSALEVRIVVMVPQETREEIQKLADASDRTFSAEVRRALREHAKKWQGEVDPQ